MEAPAHRSVILVIEDDRLARELLATVFEDEGYDVMAAENGEQALTVLHTISPALITLDLDLPDISGEGILTELRQSDETCDLLVVIVSARHSIPRNVRALVQAVISKPFDLDELLGTVRRLVPAPASPDSAA